MKSLFKNAAAVLTSDAGKETIICAKGMAATAISSGVVMGSFCIAGYLTNDNSVAESAAFCGSLFAIRPIYKFFGSLGNKPEN